MPRGTIILLPLIRVGGKANRIEAAWLRSLHNESNNPFSEILGVTRVLLSRRCWRPNVGYSVNLTLNVQCNQL